MATYSFMLDPNDNTVIQGQINAIATLQQQRAQIERQLAKEISYTNTIYRAALAEARLKNGQLVNVDFPEVLINDQGKYAVALKGGMVSWTSQDEKVEGEQNDGQDRH